METVLDALPAQPLTAADVATLNESATVRLIPYTWYGEQVIAVLLLHDTRDHTDETAIEDATEELESEVVDDEPADATDTEPEPEDTEDKKKAFGTRESNTVGTVEVIDDGSLAPKKDEPEEPPAQEIEAEPTGSESNLGSDSDDSSSEPEDDLHVYAAGYDDSDAAWVVIAEIDPDTEFTDAEPLIREWISDTYHDQIVDRLAVGPSEYEIDGS